MCACSAHRTATGKKICSSASEPVCVSSCRVCRWRNAVLPALQVVPIGASRIRPAQKPCAILHPAARPRTIQSNRVIPRGALNRAKPHRGTLPTGAVITPCTAKPVSRRSSPVGARACTIIPSRRVISRAARHIIQRAVQSNRVKRRASYKTAFSLKKPADAKCIRRFWRLDLQFGEVCLEGFELFAQLFRQLVAELLVVFFDFGGFFLPDSLIDGQQVFQRLAVDVEVG